MNRLSARSACALAALLAIPVSAQPVTVAGDDPMGEARPEVARPRLAGRIVQRFDFEEGRINPFPVPRNWRRAQGINASADGSERPGFPGWNEAALDYRSAATGEGSVFLPAAGGSACLRLEPGVVPVFPGADYLVSAKVRTRGVQHARARLVARLLDSASLPIRGSQVAGELIGDEPAWRLVSLGVPGNIPDGAFLQIDLELLQPVQFEARALGRHQVWPEDFAAAAWFDDVTITQVPRIELSTASPVNVVRAPDLPEIRAEVRDLTGEVMRARLTLHDLDGRETDSEEREIGAGQGSWTWAPRIGAFGWYRGSLEVFSGAARVGGASLDLVWLPAAEPDAPARVSADRERFGVVLEPIPAGVADRTATLIRHSGAGAVTIPMWNDGLTAATARQAADALAPVFDTCLLDGTRLTFALARVPRALSAETRAEPDDPLAVFAGAEREWEPYLMPFLDKYGQSVRRWQVGVPLGAGRRALADRLHEMRHFERILSGLVPGPVIALSWPATVILDREAVARHGPPDAVDVIVEASTTPDDLGAYVEEWHDPAPPGALTVVLRTAPATEGSRRGAVIDLARRAIVLSTTPGTRESGTPGAISQPWSWTEGDRPRAVPHAELGAWRCLGDRLGGMRFADELPMSGGVRAVIFEPEADDGRSGLLVAWRETAEPHDAAIDAFLGSGPVVAYDLFGNATPIEATAVRNAGTAASSRSHVIPVTDSPVFVEGVDAGLARFIASLRLEPWFVPTTSTEHEIAVVLDNPWPEPISGRLLVVEPGGQGPSAQRDRTSRVSPRQIAFSIPAGETVSLPVTLTFAPMEEAGVKPFVVDVDLEGRPEYGRLRLRSAFEIGLEDLRLDLTHRFAPEPAGQDVVVEAKVTNQGPAPVTLELTAFAPPGAGFARSRASVTGLAPGESAVRRFAFPGGAARLRAGSVLVGVQDTASGARLNRSVAIVEDEQVSR